LISLNTDFVPSSQWIANRSSSNRDLVRHPTPITIFLSLDLGDSRRSSMSGDLFDGKLRFLKSHRFDLSSELGLFSHLFDILINDFQPPSLSLEYVINLRCMVATSEFHASNPTIAKTDPISNHALFPAYFHLLLADLLYSVLSLSHHMRMNQLISFSGPCLTVSI
jgi:hypothetical protein